MDKLEKLSKFQILISCIILSLALILASIIFANRIPKNEQITVTGSASKIVKSDYGKLNFSILVHALNQKEAYRVVKTQLPKVIEYLKNNNVSDDDINVKPITGYNTYKQNNQGYDTNTVVGYNLTQQIEVKSTDVLKIKKLSTDIQSLINDGFNLEIYPAEYYYSDMASIKIELLEQAAKDAKLRAQSMLKATGSNVSKVKSMRMGVFQITPPNSTMVTDMGVNDVTTIDKKITAVSSVVFKVK